MLEPCSTGNTFPSLWWHWIILIGYFIFAIGFLGYNWFESKIEKFFFPERFRK